jgi:O-antigen/teichoic acid export membrane protein
MVQTPMSLIGSSLAHVFFQKISSSKKSDLNSIVKKFILKASMLSLPIFLIIYFFAVDIFIVVFGENWKLAGEVASIMSPWLFLNFLTTPMANIFIVLNRQEIVLMVSLFYMLIPIGILLAFNEFGFLNVLALITYSMSLMLLLYIGLVFIYTKKEENNGL